MSWTAVCAMFEGVGSRLRTHGKFSLYGPFNENGRYTSSGNEAFDRQLRAQNPAMGLRDVEELESLGGEHHLELVSRHAMPSNNLTLVFSKTADGP